MLKRFKVLFNCIERAFYPIDAVRKLFVYMMLIINCSTQAGNFTKLNKRVRFPENLNMTPYMSGFSDRFPQYNLYGVVVHLDVMNAAVSGHYVCYVKNYLEEWFKIDDSVVCLLLQAVALI